MSFKSLIPKRIYYISYLYLEAELILETMYGICSILMVRFPASWNASPTHSLRFPRYIYQSHLGGCQQILVI